jgi:hypothetical protein
MLEGTETSQIDIESPPTQTLTDLDDGGFEATEYEFETPTRNPLEETPLPVEPYRSFHSTPPSSPGYEEYQVPIPTSSSPVRHPLRDTPSFINISTQGSPLAPTRHDQVTHRRARSRSASRERRMSIAPVPQWQGLPSTPRRGVSEDSETADMDQESLSTMSTEVRSPVQPVILPVCEARNQASCNESMTPVRNWAAQIAEGAFRSEKSPSKIAQLPIVNQVGSSRAVPVTVEDEDEDMSEKQIDVPELDDFPEQSYSPPKSLPQISRLRESPIVITSSPQDQPVQVRYQWKTTVDPQPDVEHSLSPTPQLEWPLSDSNSEMGASQGRLSSSRQSSPARSILADFGNDVVDISSMSPFAAKRAAEILLRTPFYSKITFDDERGRKIWEDAKEEAGDYELTQIEIESDNEPQTEGDEQPETLPKPEPPSRISQGEWTKLDWKRLEKCLCLTDGDTNDAIDLFQSRYIGRERCEVEMRCRAVLLTRRRRILEGRKVEFILSTDQ